MDNNSILKTLIGEGKDDTINSVGILVFYRNKMLTTQRKSGTWSIPKGRIKEGEEPLLAISREVVEELGFALPKIPRKIKVIPKENGGKHHLYAVILDRMETIVLNDEHTQYHWEDFDKEKGITLPSNFDNNFCKIFLSLITGTEPCDSSFKPIK